MHVGMGVSSRSSRPVVAGHCEPECSTELASSRMTMLLDGGGARSAASYGVLEQMARRGIIPDMCLGVSAGALFGAAHCLGIGLSSVETAVGEAFGAEGSRIRVPLLLALAATASQRGARLRGMLESIFGSATLEDCSPRLRVVCAVGPTPSKATALTITRGSVADAVQASMAHPALLGPCETEWGRAWDGTVTDWTVGSALGEWNRSILVRTTLRHDPAAALRCVKNHGEFLQIDPKVAGIRWFEFDRIGEAARFGSDAAERATFA